MNCRAWQYLCVATLLVAGCRLSREAATGHIACSPDQVLRWTGDSSGALCLPHGFVARNPRLFARPRGDTLPENWIAVSVETITSAEPQASWPLHLASGPDCRADCTTVEELRAYPDTIAGFPAHVERGLVSGGISGEWRQPSLLVSVTLPSSRRAVINAIAVNGAVLDTLARAVRRLR